MVTVAETAAAWVVPKKISSAKEKIPNIILILTHKKQQNNRLNQNVLSVVNVVIGLAATNVRQVQREKKPESRLHPVLVRHK